MGSDPKETKEERLSRLVSALSEDIEGRTKAIEAVSRDVSIGAEQLLQAAKTKLRIQRARQLEMAYEVGQRLESLMKQDCGAGDVARLLFIKTLLEADINASMNDFDAVLKVIAGAAKDMTTAAPAPAKMPDFGPKRGLTADDE